RRALAKDNHLVLPRANLGLAYLVHPQGKDPEEAAKWFAEAIKLYKQDKNLDSLNLAALLVNAAVADLALGKTDKTAAKLQAAENLESKLPLTSLVRTLEDAIFYNRALLDMAAKDRAKNLKAFTGLEKYLLLSSPDSAWWPLAYEKYEKLSKSVALPP